MGDAHSMAHYSKEDFLDWLKMLGQMKDSGYLNAHYLWDIPKKEHTKNTYDDYELTE